MMTSVEHDGAASLRVVNRPDGERYSSGHLIQDYVGWYVARTCSCHLGERIAGPFDNREHAEHALAVLDADARRYAA
jgi:hypothetical protein